MPRRALRPSFVVTFALGAAAIAGGCGKDSGGGDGNGGISSGSNPPAPTSDGGDGSISDGGCPAGQPTNGTPCDLPSSVTCFYGTCTPATSGVGTTSTAWCQQGMTWTVQPGVCNPPAPVYEAGPDGDDAGPDGEGQDGSHD